MSPVLVLLAFQTRSSALAIEPDLKGAVLTLGSMTRMLRRTADSPEVFVAPELRDEAIFVRGDFGSPERLRALVARAASAEWVPSGSGLLLQRSRERVRTLREAERATLLADVRAALPKDPAPPTLTPQEFERLQESVRPRSGGEAAGSPKIREERLRAVQRKLDLGERTGARFLASLDPKALVDAFTGTVPSDSVRFLGRGGHGFARLPVDGPTLIAAYRSEREMLAPPQVTTDPQVAALRAWQSQAVSDGELGIVVTRFSNRFAFTLYTVAGDGRSAAIAWAYANPPARRPEEPLWPGESLRPDRMLDRPLDWARAKPGTETIPSTDDPLETFVGPYLRAFLAEESRPVVLDLPDEAYWTPMTKLSWREASRNLRGALAVEEVDGAIVGRPRFPVAATEHRFPRREVKNWIAAVTDSGLSLDRGFDVLARLGKSSSYLSLETALNEIADPRLRNGVLLRKEHPLYQSPISRAALRFWGHLPVAARRALDDGSVVRPRELSATVEADLLAIVLAHERTTSQGLAFLDRNGRADLELRDRIRNFAQNGGLPVALVEEGVSRGQTFDASRLGEVLELLRDDESIASYWEVRNVRLRVGSQALRGFEIAFAPAPMPPINVYLGELRLAPNSVPRWEALPESFLNAVQKAKEAFRARNGGGGARTN